MDFNENFGKVGLAILAALLTYIVSDRRSKKQNTFELHKEFHSSDFLASRTAADALLAGSSGKDIEKLRKSENTQFSHLSRVLHFFQNLQSLKHSRLIDKRLAKAFFAGYFDYFKQFFDALFALESNKESTQWVKMYSDLKKLEKWLK